MPSFAKRLDELVERADQLDADVLVLGKDMKAELSKMGDPPGWFEDSLDELQDAKELAHKLVQRLTSAHAEARKGGA